MRSIVARALEIGVAEVVNGSEKPCFEASEIPTLNLAEVMDRVRAFLCDYMVFPHDEQATIIALWVTHTWVIEAFTFSPYLNIGSPVKRCGKSTLLECLKLLTNKPWAVVTPSPAVLFRKIELDCPTLLLDEVDTIFSSFKGDDGKEELRAVLNSGFQRGVKVARCVGPTHTLAEFSVFCAKALAGIGKLPDTVADRSIPIVLARKPAGQIVAKFRWRDVAPKAKEISEALAAWAQRAEVIPLLSDARPDSPQGLSDRAADISEPLLALADMAGGDWPDAARVALVKLCGETSTEDDNLPAKLLLACREIFAASGTDRLSSVELLKALVAREDDAPWAVWWESDLKQDKTQAPASRLARLLKPFEIKPRAMKDKGETVRGYFLESFEDAFVRYLPGE